MVVVAKHNWDKSDTILLLWFVVPLVIGMSCSILGYLMPSSTLFYVGLFYLGIGCGVMVGLGTMRQAMLKWLRKIGIKVEGKAGEEIVSLTE